MKKLLLISAIFLSLASCGTQKKVSEFLSQHNYQQTIKINPLTNESDIKASIDSLYNYTEVAKLCSQADVTFHISKASITVTAKCDGAVEKVSELLKKLLAAVKFNQ